MRVEPERLTQFTHARYGGASPSANTMRGLAFFLLIGAAALTSERAAVAAPVAGKVTLPTELKAGRRHHGYWRLENGIVPVAPASARGDTVVVLTGTKGQAPAAKTITVEIAGLQATPSTVVVGEGSVVEFKNNDRVPHDLSTPANTSLMAIERLPPRGVRRQKFSTAGAYVVRCTEYPHMIVSVLVVNTPHFAVVDDKGAFKMPDVAEPKAALKVWSDGRWVHEQEIDTAAAGDLQVKVAAPGNKETE